MSNALWNLLVLYFLGVDGFSFGDLLTFGETDFEREVDRMEFLFTLLENYFDCDRLWKLIVI